MEQAAVENLCLLGACAGNQRLGGEAEAQPSVAWLQQGRATASLPRTPRTVGRGTPYENQLSPREGGARLDIMRDFPAV